ncbi:MAG TPA: dihydrodipicolinate synthase family protein [Planctomycetota bacterium]|nr:dihydrodipicolinate synthase family protein [Planctomycetota bacterium]
MIRLGDKRLTGVWSATPTPLTEKLDVDVASVRRMVEHHVRLGVNGLFVAGTCGEGPWLTRDQFERLVAATAEHSNGRLLIAAQVSDNSAGRVLDNIAIARRAGTDIAVIAPPTMLLNATRENLLTMYREAIRGSALPVGVYDRGRHGPIVVPAEVLGDAMLEENVVMMKDSSSDPERRDRALAVRRKRPGLSLLTGDEFDSASYLKAGYDGVLLGGAIVTGHAAGLMIEAAQRKDDAALKTIQDRVRRLLYDLYGGEKIECWLSGLKHALVEMDIFSTHRNLLNYPLTPLCKAAIKTALERDADLIFPQKRS